MKTHNKGLPNGSLFLFKGVGQKTSRLLSGYSGKKSSGVTKNKNYYLLLRPQKAKFATFFRPFFAVFLTPIFKVVTKSDHCP